MDEREQEQAVGDIERLTASLNKGVDGTIRRLNAQTVLGDDEPIKLRLRGVVGMSVLQHSLYSLQKAARILHHILPQHALLAITAHNELQTKLLKLTNELERDQDQAAGL